MTDLKDTSDLKRQRDLSEQFESWFAGGGQEGGGLKEALVKNRARYRMQLEDEAERLERGLSALPSTKSVSVVDNFVIDAIEEYHGEKDAISYTAKESKNTEKDDLAKWLTAIIQYRMEHTFPFATWHLQSLKCGSADGMEAAMISWKKESYMEPEKKFVYNTPQGPQEISEQAYVLESAMNPETVAEIEYEKEYTVTDTWWIDQLKPGENLLWDFKNPILDLNSGEWCMVVLNRSPNEIKQLRDRGVFDKLPKGKKGDAVIEKYQDTRQTDYIDSHGVATDPETVDVEEYNRVPIWLFFSKEGCQWKCSFSIEGRVELSEEKKVNEVFFGGRRVDKLPVIMGCSDFELWEPIGRGLPKLIGPIEDELIDSKNNANDYAKQVVQGRVRITPDADVDEDEVLNAKAFYAEEGEIEFLPNNPGFMESLRVADSLTADLMEIAPMGMESKNFVPKGIDKTLGAIQLQQGNVDRKLSTRLLVRNETFFKPLLKLIAEMEFSFETDETILRIAGSQAKVQPPQTQTERGMVIDLSKLDFPVDINVNAGLGNIPKQQKARKIMEIGDWRTGHQIPTDMKKIAGQLNVLAGFAEDQWDIQVQPEQPEVEYKLDISVDYNDLPPQVRQMLVQKAMTSEGSKVTAKVKRDKEAIKERKRLYGVDERPNAGMA